MSLTCSSTGDIGDIIFLLCILKQLPDGPHTLVLRSSMSTKAKGPEGVQRLFDAVEPLAAVQPYIKEVVIGSDRTKVDWASEEFRRRHYTVGETLMQAHLNHLIQTKGIGHGFNGADAWLTVEPSAVSKGRIIINRTGRYRNDSFPWAGIVSHYRHRLLFVGLEHEWREFIGHFGYVEFHRTKDMLEVAQLIAGSDLFIGNQSCANACAEGLKHDLIQETNLQFPDCIYPRPNAQHVADGNVLLPGNIRLEPVSMFRGTKRTHITPPKGWQYEGFESSPNFDVLVKSVSKGKGMPFEKASDLVYRANLDRCPQFFRDLGQERELVRYKAAIQSNNP